MIEARSLTRRYGAKTAVDGIDFTVRPGRVTGFLGPNGAGKSTTMRMIMGLDRPSAGSVTVNGRHYSQHRAPLRQVGALLDANAVHPGRSARSHLPQYWLALTGGVGYLVLAAGSDWITEPWQGALVLIAWITVLFTTAAVLLKHRDA